MAKIKVLTKKTMARTGAKTSLKVAPRHSTTMTKPKRVYKKKSEDKQEVPREEAPQNHIQDSTEQMEHIENKLQKCAMCASRMLTGAPWRQVEEKTLELLDLPEEKTLELLDLPEVEIDILLAKQDIMAVARTIATTKVPPAVAPQSSSGSPDEPSSDLYLKAQLADALKMPLSGKRDYQGKYSSKSGLIMLSSDVGLDGLHNPTIIAGGANRRAKAGPAVAKSTNIGEDLPAEVQEEDFSSLSTHATVDNQTDPIFGATSFYVRIVNEKADAFERLFEVSGASVAMDILAEDMCTDPHIECGNDAKLVLNQVHKLVLARAKGCYEATKDKGWKQTVTGTRSPQMLGYNYGVLRTLLDPVIKKFADEEVQAAGLQARGPEIHPEQAADKTKPLGTGEHQCNGTGPTGPCGTSTKKSDAQKPDKASASGVYYANLKKVLMFTEQESLALHDDYHEPLLKVWDITGCCLVSLEPSYDLNMVHEGGQGTVQLAVQALVKHSKDGSGTQLGFLFLGAKSGFAGVESITAGWPKASILEIQGWENAKVFLLQK